MYFFQHRKGPYSRTVILTSCFNLFRAASHRDWLRRVGVQGPVRRTYSSLISAHKTKAERLGYPNSLKPGLKSKYFEIYRASKLKDLCSSLYCNFVTLSFTYLQFFFKRPVACPSVACNEKVHRTLYHKAAKQENYAEY